MKGQLSIKKVTENKAPREEVKFHYSWYLLILFTIYLGSLVIPAILFMTYVILFFLPNFLEITNFFTLFTEIKAIIALISMPLVIIGCYLIRIFLIGVITREFWRWSERKSPSKNGIIPRNFPSKTLDYYQVRSFMIKYPKNVLVKGVFPWLSNWFYNFIGANKIGKETTFEESPSNDRFMEIGNNCYFGVNSAIATHVVEGIFGNISYFQSKVGDNVTTAAANVVGPGSEVKNDSYLLPLAATPKHSMLKGKNYYWGMPLRRIFKKKIMKYLRIRSKDLKINANIEQYKENKVLNESEAQKIPQKNEINQKEQNDSNSDNHNLNTLIEQDLAIDFTTSSAISRVNIKFLAIYLPIFWLSGMLTTILFYTFTLFVRAWIMLAFFLPAMIIFMWFIFIMGCFFFSKLFLILINLIHKPKEGIFRAEKGNSDFEFWCLRTELKKIVFWLIRNWPLPWMDIMAFKVFGIKMTLSSSLWDAWCDGEFIKFGHKVLVGQGAAVMSSTVVGKYLIIKEVIFDDYVVIGGQAVISPGTVIGKESIVGALSTTNFNQILDPGWIYLGVPVTKFKPNKYATMQREILMKRDVDEEKKFEIEYEVNIEEDKKDLV
ncbi:MAG: hypothetical protein JSV62_09665 [Promethearchaeota archaeon]|nr:MAG: hypothetical protein JSV62_09665 [Candidatus Lokiarchaeota archaeon]